MTKSWKEKNQERTKFWRTHIEQWTETGLSQREYCKQNNLRSNRFTYWKVKFSKTDQPMELVQIPFPIHHFKPPGLKINIGRGLQVEIPDGFKKETLEQVLLALKVVS
ncbi:MAG: IS66 family insertion sequence element accessory protein TnpB [Desulfobacter sp.]|nr:MAG: IS66 family insertion sequence element accessory protein TnpB [Desulfobacter sp.]